MSTEAENYDFVYVKLGGAWEKAPHNDGGFILNWGVNNLGFGQLTFYNKDGKTTCETECMSKEFIKQALSYFLEHEVQFEDI
jgi:hypothetical protein